MWISLLGGVLLFVLLAGKGCLGQQNSEERHPDGVDVSRIEKLTNVWVADVDRESIIVYRDGVEERYLYGIQPDGTVYLPDPAVREQVADVLLADDHVICVEPQLQKIHGRILGADENAIVVQGYGDLQLSSDYRGYRIYGALSMCTYRDLVFGYDFADLVLKNGEVCGILMVREEAMEEIRVLIKTSDFARNVHDSLVVTSDVDFAVYRPDTDESEICYRSGEKLLITEESEFFTGERIRIRPGALTGKIVLKNVQRSQGVPGYRGELELVKTEGGFAVVNILPLEEYLYSVVPSEMPASYDLEALKAQAVCARTYAYGHMLHAAYPTFGAHVDDSTAFQVYNNCSEQESTTRAVKETRGKLLYAPDGTLAETYYYSTSCGTGTDAGIWMTEASRGLTYLQAGLIREGTSEENGNNLCEEERFQAFITGMDPLDFESGEAWYRWTYCVGQPDAKRMAESLKKRYQVRPDLILTQEKGEFVAKEPEDFSVLKSIHVTGRGNGGVVQEVTLETNRGTYRVMSEHNIRTILCDGVTKVRLADGRLAEVSSLLPSGFFVLETKTGKKNEGVIGYTVTGGGFGHGVGMSQNAAKHMADQGYDHEWILSFFYKDCEIRNYESEHVL